MTFRTTKAPEERALLNPGFCSCLLWHAVVGYTNVTGVSMPFEVAFVILALVLHRQTRQLLPRTVATSLVVWLDANPLLRVRIAHRAQALSPFTKDALMFGGIYGLFRFDTKEGTMVAHNGFRGRMAAHARGSSEEVQACLSKAAFVGKWLARAGSTATVLALMGVKP